MTLKNAIVIYVALLTECGEVMTAQYADKSEAINDGAVVRGWIPAELPNSATDILEKHDLDTNVMATVFRAKDNEVSQLTNACSETETYYEPSFFKRYYRIAKKENSPIYDCKNFYIAKAKDKYLIWYD